MPSHLNAVYFPCVGKGALRNRSFVSGPLIFTSFFLFPGNYLFYSWFEDVVYSYMYQDCFGRGTCEAAML